MPFQFSVDEAVRLMDLRPEYIHSFCDLTAYEDDTDLRLLLKCSDGSALTAYFETYCKLGGDVKAIGDRLVFLLHELTRLFPENDMTKEEFIRHMNILLDIVKCCKSPIDDSSLFNQTKIKLLILALVTNSSEPIGVIDVYLLTLDKAEINQLAEIINCNYPDSAAALYLKLGEKFQLMSSPNNFLQQLEIDFAIALFACLNRLSADTDRNTALRETEQFFFKYMDHHCALIPIQKIIEIEGTVALYFIDKNAGKMRIYADKYSDLGEKISDEKRLRLLQEALQNKQFHVVCSMAQYIPAYELMNELYLNHYGLVMVKYIRDARARAVHHSLFYDPIEFVCKLLVLSRTGMGTPADNDLADKIISDYSIDSLSEQEYQICVIAIRALIQPGFLHESRLFNDFLPYFKEGFTASVQNTILTILYKNRTRCFDRSSKQENKPFLSLMSFMQDSILAEFALSETVIEPDFLTIVICALRNKALGDKRNRAIRKFIKECEGRHDFLLAAYISGASVAPITAVDVLSLQRSPKYDGSCRKENTSLSGQSAPLPKPVAEPSLAPQADTLQPIPAVSVVASDRSEPVVEPVYEEVVVIEGNVEKNAALRRKNATLREQNAMLSRQIEFLMGECDKLKSQCFVMGERNALLVSSLQSAEEKFTLSLRFHDEQTKQEIASREQLLQKMEEAVASRDQLLRREREVVVGQEQLLQEIQGALDLERRQTDLLRKELELSNKELADLRAELSSIKKEKEEPVDKAIIQLQSLQKLVSNLYLTLDEKNRVIVGLQGQLHDVRSASAVPISPPVHAGYSPMYFSAPRPPLPLTAPPITRLKGGVQIVIDIFCPVKRDNLIVKYCFLYPGRDTRFYVLQLMHSRLHRDASGRECPLVDMDKVLDVTTVHFSGEQPPHGELLRLECDEKGSNLRLFRLKDNYAYAPVLDETLCIDGLYLVQNAEGLRAGLAGTSRM